MEYYSKYIKYQKKYTHLENQIGGSDPMSITKFHSKRDICNKKSFNNDQIINEIYQNNLLGELHSNLILTSQKDHIQLNEYNESFGKLNTLITSILSRIRRDNPSHNFKMHLLNLVSHIIRYNDFPPQILQYIQESEKQKIKTSIQEYKIKLLQVEDIGYHMCTTLYNKYISKRTSEDDYDTEIFKYVLKTTIKRFDSNKDILDNFDFFHKNFKNTFKNMSQKLGVCYLTRTAIHSNYLVLAKTSNGKSTKEQPSSIKFITDINKDDQVYLKNTLDNFMQPQNDETKKIKENNLNKKLQREKGNINRHNQEIKELDNDIENYQLKINELESKIDNYWDKLHGTIEEYQSITEKENVTDFDRQNLSHYENQVNYYKDQLGRSKKWRSETQKHISSIYSEKSTKEILDEKYDRWFITPEIMKKYQSEIVNCIHNYKNILVPIELLDLTKDEKVSNINKLILNKDNMSARLKLHAGMLFINTEKKYIEHFEPHGVSATYDTVQVADILKNLHSKIPELANYDFITQHQMCPIIQGPQALDRSFYCYIHSGYYSMLRILHPNKSSEEIGTMLISKIDENDENDTTNTPSLDYLQKKYARLSGSEIKTRLENFMKWHRYIVNFMNSPNKKLVDQLSNVIKSVIPPLKFD